MKTNQAPGNHLEPYHFILIQSGLIVILTLFIVVFRFGAQSYTGPELLDFDKDRYVYEVYFQRIVDHKFVQLESSEISIRENPAPPAPPRVRVTAHAPEDEIVEDMHMDLEFEMTGPDYLPVPLPSIRSKVEYYFGDTRLPDMAPFLLNRMRELQDRIEYPDRARRHGIEGRVYVQFIINELGRVENPRVLRGIGGGCDEAVVEALKELQLIPGLIDGRPVRVKLTFYVTFRLIHR
jgi:periplasmic protein TonB